MATGYVLTADIQIRQLLGLGSAVSKIQKTLNSIATPAIDRAMVAGLNRINTAAMQTTKTLNSMAAKAQAISMPKFNGGGAGLTGLARAQQNYAASAKAAASSSSILTTQVDQLTRASVVGYRTWPLLTAKLWGYVAAIKAAGKAIEFQSSLADIATLAGKTTSQMQGFGDAVLETGIKYGANTKNLQGMVKELTQAGFSINQTKELMDGLAKVSLTPSFKNPELLSKSVILLREAFQVKEVDQFESALEKINRISLKTAASADDIADAMKRSGATLSGTNNTLEQSIALIATGASRTQRSGAVIGNSLKSIANRVSNPEHRAKAKELLGVDLVDDQDRQLPLTDIVQRLAGAKKNFAPGSVQFAAGLQAIAGSHQSDVLRALVDGADDLRKNLEEVSKAGTSVDDALQNASDTLENRLNKLLATTEKLANSLIRSKGFNALADGFIKAADGAARLGEALTPLLPTIAALAAGKISGNLIQRGRPERGYGSLLPIKHVQDTRLNGGVRLSDQMMKGAATDRAALFTQIKAHYATEIAIRQPGLRLLEVEKQARQQSIAAWKEATSTILRFNAAGRVVGVSPMGTRTAVDWRKAGQIAGGVGVVAGFGAANWAAQQSPMGAGGAYTPAAGEGALTGFNTALFASMAGLGKLEAGALGAVGAIVSFAAALNENEDRIGVIRGEQLSESWEQQFQADPLGKGSVAGLRKTLSQQTLDFAAKHSGDRNKLQRISNFGSGLASWASGKGFNQGIADAETLAMTDERKGFIARNRANLERATAMRDKKVSQSSSLDEFLKGGGVDILAAIDQFDDGLMNSSKALRDKVAADILARKATENAAKVTEKAAFDEKKAKDDLTEAERRLTSVSNAYLSAVEQQVSARSRLDETRIAGVTLNADNAAKHRALFNPNDFNNGLRDAEDQYRTFSATQDILAPGIGENAGALAARINRKQEQTIALEQERANLKDTDTVRTSQIDAQLKSLAQDTDLARRALTNLAQSSDKVAAAMFKLERMNSSDQSRASLAERYLGGDPQARFDLNVNNVLAEQALQKGNFNFDELHPLFRGEAQRRALEGFNAAGNILLPGRNGETAADAKLRLLKGTRDVQHIANAPQTEIQMRQALQAQIIEHEKARQATQNELVKVEQRTIDLFGTHVASFSKSVADWGAKVDELRKAIETGKIDVDHKVTAEHHVALTGADRIMGQLKPAIDSIVVNSVNNALGKTSISSASPMQKMVGKG